VRHKLNIDESYLTQLLSGKKTFEVRLNDRGYNAGDTLEFHDPSCLRLGPDCRKYVFDVLYVYSGIGLQPNYVVMSVALQQSEMEK